MFSVLWLALSTLFWLCEWQCFTWIIFSAGKNSFKLIISSLLISPPFSNCNIDGAPSNKKCPLGLTSLTGLTCFFNPFLFQSLDHHKFYTVLIDNNKLVFSNYLRLKINKINLTAEIKLRKKSCFTTMALSIIFFWQGSQRWLCN